MNSTNKKYLLVGVAVGILCLVLASKLKMSPKTTQGAQRSTLVTVTSINQQAIAPQIKGFGRVMPKHTWRGVAEVSGRIIYRNPLLEIGRLVPKGTEILAIDPTEYQLQVAQAKANIRATQASLTSLSQEEKNVKLSLAIEQKRLTLAKQELDRKKRVSKQGLISKSELDQQEQSYFAQLNMVQDLENKLKLMPDQRKVTQAQLKVDELKLSDAELDLSRTKLSLPFDARIAEVNIETNQVVSMNETMVVAQQLGIVEIMAEFTMNDLRALVGSLSTVPIDGLLPSIEKASLNGEVILHFENKGFTWPAKVTRIAQEVDANNATIGMYLEVEQDFKHLDLPASPPLAKGMFVSAHVKGKLTKQWVVPEKALHGDKIYLMDDAQKLRISPVTTLFRSDVGGEALVAISATINSGDVLVLNDIIPAIDGMQLRTQTNEKSPSTDEGIR